MGFNAAVSWWRGAIARHGKLFGKQTSIAGKSPIEKSVDNPRGRNRRGNPIAGSVCRRAARHL
jgi:hypothetical protein